MRHNFKQAACFPPNVSPTPENRIILLTNTVFFPSMKSFQMLKPPTRLNYSTILGSCKGTRSAGRMFVVLSEQRSLLIIKFQQMPESQQCEPNRRGSAPLLTHLLPSLLLLTVLFPPPLLSLLPPFSQIGRAHV